MSVGLYFDRNVSRAVTQGLRIREVDVLTALEDRAHRLSDPDLLDRATEVQRVLFSSDEDLIVEARRRQRESEHFAGVIFAPQSCPVGVVIEDLELLAKTGDPRPRGPSGCLVVTPDRCSLQRAALEFSW